MGVRVLNSSLIVILVLRVCSLAYAVSSYKNQFNTRYGTAGTNLDQCLLCHISNSNYGLNPYGTAHANAGHNFAAIEQLDSD